MKFLPPQPDIKVTDIANAMLSMQRLRDPQDGKVYVMTAFDFGKGIGLSCVSHPRDDVMWVKNANLFEIVE